MVTCDVIGWCSSGEKEFEVVCAKEVRISPWYENTRRAFGTDPRAFLLFRPELVVSNDPVLSDHSTGVSSKGVCSSFSLPSTSYTLSYLDSPA
jgi:hypothetical protein